MNDMLVTATYLNQRLMLSDPGRVWNWVRKYDITREQAKELMAEPRRVMNLIYNDADPTDDWTDYANQAYDDDQRDYEEVRF